MTLSISVPEDIERGSVVACDMEEWDRHVEGAVAYGSSRIVKSEYLHVIYKSDGQGLAAGRGVASTEWEEAGVLSAWKKRCGRTQGS